MKTLLVLATTFVAAAAAQGSLDAAGSAPRNLYQVIAPLDAINNVLDQANIDIWDLDISSQDPKLMDAQIYTTEEEIKKLQDVDTLLDDSSKPAVTLVQDSNTIRDSIAEDQQQRQACLARTSKTFTSSSLQKLNRIVDSDFFQCFRPMNQIFEFLDALTKIFTANGSHNGVLTKLPTIGKTYEGESIPAYKLSTGSGDTKKQALYIQSLIHAREFIAGSSLLVTVTTLLDQLRGVNQEIQALFGKYDLYFVPIANIDGYKFAWNRTRLWRKNRRIKDDSGRRRMYGVDLNRNWGPTEIFNLDHDTDLRSEIYPGESMYSEPETQAVHAFLDTLDNLAGFIDIHSYGGLVLYPFGFQEEPMPSPFGDKIAQVADKVRQEIERNGATQQYTSQQIFEMYNEPSYGTMLDSIVVTRGNKVVVLGLEVEGTSFLADQTTILPVGKSIAAGIVQYMKEVSTYNA